MHVRFTPKAAVGDQDSNPSLSARLGHRQDRFSRLSTRIYPLVRRKAEPSLNVICLVSPLRHVVR
jgi:hypothetical protein